MRNPLYDTRESYQRVPDKIPRDREPPEPVENDYSGLDDWARQMIRDRAIWARREQLLRVQGWA